MKTYILLFFSVFLSVGVRSQEKIKEKFKYKVSYDLAYSLDSTALDIKKKEKMILFIGEDYSAFSSRARLFQGSVIVRGNAGSTSRESVTDFPYMIVKNLKDKKQYYTLQVVEDFLYYEQTTDLFNWTLSNETKEINGFKVQKATAQYAGRDFIAWFTNEIPISDGPYKFNGLPGLIIELYDTKEHYHFIIESFEKIVPEEGFKLNLKNYILTDKKNLFDVWFRYRRDPFTYVNNPNVTMTPKVHKTYIKMFSEKIEKENNRIEKN